MNGNDVKGALHKERVGGYSGEQLFWRALIIGLALLGCDVPVGV